MNRLIVALVVTAAGCQGMGGPPQVPAYVAHPTPEGHIAIEQAVAHALSVVRVDLPEDVGVSDGQVIVPLNQLKPQVRLDQYGRQFSRDPSDPAGEERFHLVKIADHCVLVHDRTGRQYDILGAVCEPR